MQTTKRSRPLVRIKEKFQVTLPVELRTRSGLAVGDFLEVSMEQGGVITLTPKSLVDRHIAEGLADLEAGRVHGPYESADEAIAALGKRTRGK
ncbi:AbrB/MazE/SpoVT family DNA-binding domain-containing protein [uncultured Paludibaculum sp.]|uniref:AbrB/MazE/SpoVT family DNA-binding domain-containing protein n=1 Tax=uncultured Paludibaculum sp. TaxID=1765020 RepID=UPI002AAB8361|nr:AbrB/MazE/SpoVT family DNA-binding domain-containing protein [uncultured Paludibaculum sp.]